MKELVYTLDRLQIKEYFFGFNLQKAGVPNRIRGLKWPLILFLQKVLY